MNIPNYTGVIPPQYTGNEIVAHAETNLGNQAEAIAMYDKVKKHLLHVNEWHKIAGIFSAKFQVTDEHGQEVNDEVHLLSYIRIDIPGPGSSEGDGYDWVQVEELNEVNELNIQSVGFRVRPVANPTGGNGHVAHFYDSVSTSTFIAIREGTKISVAILDNNILPNHDNHNLVDQVRHVSVALGAIGLFSKVQWQNLADALLKSSTN